MFWLFPPAAFRRLRDTRAIQGWLGHRSITSTAVYTALAPNRFKDFWRDRNRTPRPFSFLFRLHRHCARDSPGAKGTVTMPPRLCRAGRPSPVRVDGTRHKHSTDRRRNPHGPAVGMSRGIRRTLHCDQSPNLQLGRGHRYLVNESRKRPSLPARRSMCQGPN
jgi:hypothetical protein